MASTSSFSNRIFLEKSFSPSSPAPFSWRNQPAQTNSSGRRTYSFRNPARDRRSCASCFLSPHPRNSGGGEIFNTALLCPPCAAARPDRVRNRWTKLGTSSMDQADIIKKTRIIFRESGRVPQIHEVDPFATVEESEALGVSRVQEVELCGSDTSSEESFPLKVFFVEDASELFVIPTVNTAPGVTRPNSVIGPKSPDVKAQEILPVGAGSELPWIHFSPESHKSLTRFFDTWRPSKSSQSDVEWICVGNPRHQYKPLMDTDILKVRQVWEDMCASDRISRPDIEALGREFNDLAGKWLVFVPSSEVDHLWHKIARATHAGTLGIFAKASPSNDFDHVICVFTEDFTNVHDVNRVRKGLERLGVKTKIGYKPDIYTHCRIYMGNKWNIAPTRYHG